MNDLPEYNQYVMFSCQYAYTGVPYKKEYSNFITNCLFSVQLNKFFSQSKYEKNSYCFTKPDLILKNTTEALRLVRDYTEPNVIDVDEYVIPIKKIKKAKFGTQLIKNNELTGNCDVTSLIVYSQRKPELFTLSDIYSLGIRSTPLCRKTVPIFFKVLSTKEISHQNFVIDLAAPYFVNKQVVTQSTESIYIILSKLIFDSQKF